MSNAKVGNWFNLQESFEANGDIDIAIRDKRSGELIVCTVQTLEAYDDLIKFLSENQHVDTLQKLAGASSK
jgi:hypothetical protein